MTKNDDGIYVDQNQYTFGLEEISIPLQREGDKQSPLPTSEMKH